MESSQSSSLVAATLIVCVAGLGVPSLSRAAEVPAPTLILSGDQLPAEDQRAARVELRVDAEDLGEDAGPMGDKISEVCGEVLAAEGVADASDPLDPVITVVIERTGGDDNPGFVVGFSIEKGDEIVPGSTRQADCSLCTRGEVIDKIREELPALVSLAREHQVPADSGEEGGGEEGGGEEGGGEEGGDEDTKAIGPMGFAGIGEQAEGPPALAGVGRGRRGRGRSLRCARRRAQGGHAGRGDGLPHAWLGRARCGCGGPGDRCRADRPGRQQAEEGTWVHVCADRGARGRLRVLTQRSLKPGVLDRSGLLADTS